MSAPDLSAEMMAQFQDSGAEKHTTILLGAGASTTSGLPEWDEFAARLLFRSGSVSTPEAAALLVDNQDPLLAAEAARAAAGDRWKQILRAALYDGVLNLDPSPLHLAAVGHLINGDQADTQLVTLNFDTLLEQAIEGEGYPVGATPGTPVSASGTGSTTCTVSSRSTTSQTSCSRSVTSRIFSAQTSPGSSPTCRQQYHGAL